MATPEQKYGAHYATGRKIQEWLENPDGDCPIPPCTLVIRDNDPQFRTVPDEDIGPMAREDLYSGTSSSSPYSGSSYSDNAPHSGGPYSNAWTHMDRYAQEFQMPLSVVPKEYNKDGWIPYYRVEKWDPIEHTFREGEERETRMLALRRRWGDPLPDDKKEDIAWDGILDKRFVVIDYIVHNHDEPHISEVTNAIYTKMFPGDGMGLRAVFVHDIHNKDTVKFISEKLFVDANKQKWPPKPGRQATFNFDFTLRPDEYRALLGTRIGKMVGYWMLGRYPRGSCKITGIHLSISPHEKHPIIDMCFQLKVTKPANKLPEPAQPAEGAGEEAAGAAEAEPAPEEEPAGEPAFLPSSPPTESYEEALKASAPDELPADKKAVAPPIPPLAPAGKPVGLGIAGVGPAKPAAGPAAPALKIVGPAAPAAKPPGKPPAAVKKAKKDNLKRKADEKEMEEVDRLFGKTRSGKQRKRD